MNATEQQTRAIEREGLTVGADNPTWSQTEDGYIYATKLTDEDLTLYIFAPSGNRYKERRAFGDNDWDVTGWSEDD